MLPMVSFHCFCWAKHGTCCFGQSIGRPKRRAPRKHLLRMETLRERRGYRLVGEPPRIVRPCQHTRLRGFVGVEETGCGDMKAGELLAAIRQFWIGFGGTVAFHAGVRSLKVY